MNASHIRLVRASNHIFRSCSRCGKELTDSASRECGIGPVCRRKNNDLFSKSIKADLPMAEALMIAVTRDKFHDQVEGFDRMQGKFLDQVAAARVNGTFRDATFEGGDFRDVVDWIDYSMSFPMNPQTRRDLVEIVEALGYTGLASIFRGDACMSEARVYVEGDRVFLVGKSSKAGWKAFKRAIRGVQTPRYRGDRTPYSAHVRHAEKFIEIANRFWPFNKIEFQVADLNLDQYGEDDVAVAAAAAPASDSSKPVAKLVVLNGFPDWFKVEMPWHGTREEMMATIAKLKTVPYRRRNYDPASRCWRFHNEFALFVKSELENRYEVQDLRA